MISEAKAYAKINLHLEVLNKRTDGYHNIFSLMASTEVSDLLKLEDLRIDDDSCRKPSIEIVSSGGLFPEIIDSLPVENNLITKAVAAYFNHTGLSGRVSLSVEKNIPSGAGMGGGSSDAAAALKLINSQLKRLEAPVLMEIGAKLGADVPYCLTGGFCLCEETGSKISPLEGALPYFVLLVNCGIHVDTAWAYRSLNRSPETPASRDDIEFKKGLIREGLQKGDISPFRQVIKNDFEGPVFREHPFLKHLREEIYSFKADISFMTGSGSTMVGLFRDRDWAEKARDHLYSKGNSVFLTIFQ